MTGKRFLDTVTFFFLAARIFFLRQFFFFPQEKILSPEKKIIAVKKKQQKTCFVTPVEFRLYVQVGTEKIGRRTERDAQVKIIFCITPCKVFWMILYQLDVQTIGTHT